MVENKDTGMLDNEGLPASRIQGNLEYQEYLKNYRHRPPLTGCTGPMTQQEFADFQTKVVEPLKQLAELASKATESTKP